MSEFWTLEQRNGCNLAFVADPDFRLGQPGSVEDLIGNGFGTGADYLVVTKTQLSEEFCHLRNGILGGVTQKLVNYGLSVIFLGDFAPEITASDAFRDYVREANKGRRFLFLKSLDDLAERQRA
ncbi:MAG: DUF4180 domain-containing protein [Hyphomicrobiaceae bacterium]|nr:DUF4180 domain-containing protein [Hyphomicrobiaceae bacterium]MCC0023426.1 DUF4180 domain-containing protein [Hyphomicrobiaceae bacterium]